MTHNFRKGDVVTVRATVRYGSDIAGDGRVSLDLGYNGVTIDADRVELVEPRLDIGERVIGEKLLPAGTVRGISSGRVWVEHDNGNFRTYLAGAVSLADPIAVDPPPYVSPGADEHGQTLADRTPDLPHLADALADF